MQCLKKSESLLGRMNMNPAHNIPASDWNNASLSPIPEPQINFGQLKKNDVAIGIQNIFLGEFGQPLQQIQLIQTRPVKTLRPERRITVLRNFPITVNSYSPIFFNRGDKIIIQKDHM